MSAARQQQVAIDTKKVLKTLRRGERPSLKLMRDMRLLPKEYPLDGIRGEMGPQWLGVGWAQEYSDVGDAAMSYEGNTCYAMYYHVLEVAARRGDRKVRFTDALHAICSIQPEWSMDKAEKVAKYFWWHLIELATRETPISVFVDRQMQKMERLELAHQASVGRRGLPARRLINMPVQIE